MKSIKPYKSFIIFALFLILFLTGVFLLKEEGHWIKVKGNITYAKQLGIKRYLYAIEYDAPEKIRVFKESEKEPFLGQEVSLKYKESDPSNHKLLWEIRYKNRIE